MLFSDTVLRSISLRESGGDQRCSEELYQAETQPPHFGRRCEFPGLRALREKRFTLSGGDGQYLLNGGLERFSPLLGTAKLWGSVLELCQDEEGSTTC